MPRLCRTLRLYLNTALTWRAAWRLAANAPRPVWIGKHFRLVRRDGLIYVEPVVQ